MALSLDNVITNHTRTPLILFHGQSGTGKSTIAANAPRPIFLCTERGLGRNEALKNVPALNIASWRDMIESFQILLADKCARFGTIVIDSVDHAEPLVQAVVCDKHKVSQIEDIPYGKGYIFQADIFRTQFGPWIEALRDVGYLVILIAHSSPVKESPPDSAQGFTRWAPKLHKRTDDYLREICDVIGYCAIPLITAEAPGSGFQKNGSAKIVGMADRRLYLQPSGGYVAKCRDQAPDYIPLMWPELAKYLSGIPAN